MSNIAGKSYGMSVVSPIRHRWAWLNRLLFWLVGTRLFRPKLNGLLTLSLIHYARWAIVRPRDFPRLDPSQPKEDGIKYTYEFFFSNFNGSWAQYVDSFSSAIPSGLDLLWKNNVKYPKSVPFSEFHDYITYNQIWTSHYYNAYPMAASNDVKSAKTVKERLLKFMQDTDGATAEKFQDDYNRMLFELQYNLSKMEPSPVVSLADQAIAERKKKQAYHS